MSICWMCSFGHQYQFGSGIYMLPRCSHCCWYINRFWRLIIPTKARCNNACTLMPLISKAFSSSLVDKWLCLCPASTKLGHSIILCYSQYCWNLVYFGKPAANESYLPVVYAEKWLDFPKSGIPVGFSKVITVINGGLFLWLTGFPKEWDSPWIFRCDYSMKRYFIGLSKG